MFLEIFADSEVAGEHYIATVHSSGELLISPLSEKGDDFASPERVLCITQYGSKAFLIGTLTMILRGEVRSGKVHFSEIHSALLCSPSLLCGFSNSWAMLDTLNNLTLFDEHGRQTSFHMNSSAMALCADDFRKNLLFASESGGIVVIGLKKENKLLINDDGITLALSVSRSFVMSSNDKDHLTLWEPNSFIRLHRHSYNGAIVGIADVSWKQQVWGITSKSELLIWNTEKSLILHDCRPIREGQVNCITSNASCEIVVAGGTTNELLCWKVSGSKTRNEEQPSAHDQNIFFAPANGSETLPDEITLLRQENECLHIQERKRNLEHEQLRDTLKKLELDFFQANKVAEQLRAENTVLHRLVNDLKSKLIELEKLKQSQHQQHCVDHCELIFARASIKSKDDAFALLEDEYSKQFEKRITPSNPLQNTVRTLIGHLSSDMKTLQKFPSSQTVEGVTSVPQWLVASLHTQLSMMELLLRQHREAVSGNRQLLPNNVTNFLATAYLVIRDTLGQLDSSELFHEALGDCSITDESQAAEKIIVALCRRAKRGS